MTRLVALAALSLLLAAPPALAQAADEDDTPIRAGARALVFGINPTSGLTGLGGTVGVQWHASAEQATRLALTLDGNVSFGDARDEQTAFVGADVLFLRYSRPRTTIYVYHGFGPTVSARFRRDAVDQNGRDESRSFLMSSAGAAGVLGVQWPVTPTISLTGEYGVSLEATYTRQRTEVSGDGQSFDQSDSSFGAALSSRGVRAGVNVYF